MEPAVAFISLPLATSDTILYILQDTARISTDILEDGTHVYLLLCIL